jgi:hypothetical protein
VRHTPCSGPIGIPNEWPGAYPPPSESGPTRVVGSSAGQSRRPPRERSVVRPESFVRWLRLADWLAMGLRQGGLRPVPLPALSLSSVRREGARVPLKRQQLTMKLDRRRTADCRMRTRAGRRVKDPWPSNQCPACRSRQVAFVHETHGVHQYRCWACHESWVLVPKRH